MESNNWVLLKVPFVSKKAANQILGIKNYANKYSIKGIAYYIVDKKNWCISWERAFISEGEYRPTDSAMKLNPKTGKPTSFYKAILDKGFDRENILNGEEGVVTKANAKQIELINQYSMTFLSTVLNIEGILSGSNPTGAEADIKKAPIIIDPSIGSEYIRFVNAIKKVRCHNKVLTNYIKQEICHYSQLEEKFTEIISLEEFIEKNKKFGKWMKIINSDFEVASNDEIVKYVSEINTKYLKDSVDHIIAMYEKELIDKNKVVTKLRNEFRVSLLKEAQTNKFPEYTNNSNINIIDAEAAHIYSVKDILENELDFKMISDKNNGLLIEPTLHKIFDKGKITFNLEGQVQAKADEYKHLENKKIIEDIWNKQRIKYLKMRNENK